MVWIYRHLSYSTFFIMSKASLSVLLLLSFGALQSLAATPRIRLDIGSDQSGCLNVTTCSYGCGKISTSATDKHILTPLCSAQDVFPNYPKRITIRGNSTKPFLYDEDNGYKYRCRARNSQSPAFLCLHKNKKRSRKSSSKSSASAANIKPNASVNAQVALKPSTSVNASATNIKPNASVSAQVAPEPSTPVSAQSHTSVKAVASPSISTKVRARPKKSVISIAHTPARSHAAAIPSSSAGSTIASVAAQKKVIKNKSKPAPETTTVTNTVEPTAVADSRVNATLNKNGSDEFALGGMDSDDLAEAFGYDKNKDSSEATKAGDKQDTCQFLSSVVGRGRGLGNLNDCCVDDDDCKNSCIDGACNQEDDVEIPECSNESYKGEGNGMGPAGVCCEAEADCQEDCVNNVCTILLNY